MDETVAAEWPEAEKMSPEGTEDQLPAWAVPTKRSDNIGMLAWRVTGDNPDLTAVQPLIDALLDAGQQRDANTITRAVGMAYLDVQGVLSNGYSINSVPYQLKLDQREDCHHLLYDVGSMLAVMERAVKDGSEHEAKLSYHLPNDQGSVYLVKTKRYRSVGARLDVNGKDGVVIGSQSEGVYQVLVK